ncbi:MAG: LPS-assembly protein LptD, partial [Phycisphaeraceae bacterium]
PTLPAPDQPLFDEEHWQRRTERRREVRPPALARREPAQPREPAPETDVDDGETPDEAPQEEAPGEQDEQEEQEEQEEIVTAAPSDEQAGPPTPDAEPGVLPTAGILRLSADRVYSPGGDENVLMLIGNVRLFYDHRTENRQVTLQTEQAVLFLGDDGEDENEGEATGGPVADDATSFDQRLDASVVRGIYLEDNVVITDGEFTVRAPRIFYDLGRQRALLFEAVMYTYDIEREVPLYVRADLLRQLSRHNFEARGVRITTSAFAEPHFAIGAGRVTLEQRDRPEGGGDQFFTATHTTFEAFGVPVFYWPYLAAETEDIPIRSAGFGYSSDTGVEVTTRWDLFALAGRRAPDDVDADLALDYRGEHGPATGVELEYDPDGMHGQLDSYLLPTDEGTDRIANRNDIEHEDETRGFVHWRHRHELTDDWRLQLEANHVSDETFLEEFFPDEAATARPYETSLYLARQQDDEMIDLLATANFNDFTPQLTQLQTPGYDVEKAPEIGYYRIGTSFWQDRLTWYSENRVSHLRADFGEDTPADRGFTQGQSLALFGFGRNTSFEQNADAMNFPDDWRTRFDTRQEISAPLQAGAFHITPYLAGRFTAYDEDFDQFSGEEDQYRLWGAAGTRFDTQFHREYDAESELLNVQGLRHIVEPAADLFVMASTIESADLPVYDPQVEAIAEGAGARLGVTNTLQTQRGGPGRWRNVDWVELQTDLVLRSDDADLAHPLPRFYPYRPEYSTGGDHFYSRLLWMVSDTLGVSGDLTYNFENDTLAEWRLGATLDHTPRLRSFLTYSEIDPLASRLLTYGFDYQLTTKYRLGFQHRLDFGENDSRTLRLSLERRLPQWRLRLYASVDEVDDEQTVGLVFVPEGFGRGAAGLDENFLRR